MHIDLVIIGIFLILTLAIGLYCSKGIATFQDYAVGNRKMGQFIIAISIIATIYGGRSFLALDDFYQESIYKTLDLIYFIILALVSRCILLRMKAFAGHFSIAESMGSLYGPTVRVITAIFGILLSIAMLAPQFKVSLSITNTLWPDIEGISANSGIILALLVISYTTLGGARAVALTDIYQFFLFGVCFPIMIFICLYYAKKPLASWQQLAELPQLATKEALRLHKLLQDGLYACVYGLCHPFFPAWIQRFYMSSSIQQASKGFYISTFIQVILTIVCLSIVMALHVGNHPIPSNGHVINYLVNLVHFPGIRGIFITAIIALLMSTADSYLHIASVLFTNDVLPVLSGSTQWVKQHALKIARTASTLIGIVSSFMMFSINYFIEFRNYIISCYPALVVPFIMAILGFRPRSTAIVLTIGMNIAIIAYHFFYKITLSAPFHKSFYFSTIALIIKHYLLPKRPNTGWVGIKDLSPLDLANQETKRWWLRRLQDGKLPFTKAYWQSRFPKRKSTFILLGIYFIIHTFIALCFMQKSYFAPYIYWYILVMAFGTTLAIYPSFHSYQQGGHPILYLAWPVLLFLFLFVSSIQFAKLDYFRPMVFALLMASLTLGSVLASLKIAIGMLVLAMILHLFVPPHIPFWHSIWTNYNTLSIELVFATALLVAALIGFGAYKYLHDKMDTQFKIIALNRNYERKAALEAIYNQVNWSRLHPIYSSKMLRETEAILQAPCYYFHTHGQRKLEIDLNLFMKKLRKFSNVLLKRVKEERILTLHQKAVQPVDINLAILKAHHTTRALGEPIALLLRNQTKVTHLIADPALFERLLTINLLGISKSEQITDHIVTLTIADTVLRYDTTLTLPALAFLISTNTSIHNVAHTYDVTGETLHTHLPKTEHQLYQAESGQIVQAHGGYDLIIEQQEALTCCYVLPIAGQNVMRFKTYDPTALGNKTSETAESLAQEKELIASLATETALTKEIIEKTITFIKNAHGLVTRKSGAPYYTHPMAVAKILLEVTKDPTTLLAGLLHDIVEDTPIPLAQIELMYGPEVAYIVDMVTHYHTSGYRWKLDDIENKSLLEQCKDIRVVQVKLADRLHNIRTLHFRKPADQKRIAKETMAFYIPWAKKNKILNWITEMNDICWEILNKKGTKW